MKYKISYVDILCNTGMCAVRAASQETCCSRVRVPGEGRVATLSAALLVRVCPSEVLPARV